MILFLLYKIIFRHRREAEITGTKMPTVIAVSGEVWVIFMLCIRVHFCFSKLTQIYNPIQRFFKMYFHLNIGKS